MAAASIRTTTANQRKRAEALTGFLFMSPALIVLAIFLIIPIGYALYLSTTDWDGITPLAQSAAVANGQVTFTNQSSETVLVPAGTVISNGAMSRVGIALWKKSLCPQGAEATISVAVQAIESGREFNVRRSQLDEIEDAALAERLEVSNDTPIENGKDDAYDFVGLDNYNKLLFQDGIRQRDFFTAFKNTVYFVLGVVPLQTILALVLAVIVNQRWLKGRGLFRTVFYFPSITSSVVISIIFMWMFTQGGLVNSVIRAFVPDYQNVVWLDDASGVIHNLLATLGITRTTVGDWAGTRLAGISLWDWLSGPSVTMLTIMILNTWTTIGTLMVIYLAALQGIPGQVYEAAAIDGATGWQTFRRITVPLLAPTTFFVITIGLIGTFQVFDQIFVISSGGPAKTTLTIAYIVYNNGFQNSEMGLAAATALILFVLIFTFTLIQRRFTSERGEM